MIDISKGRYWDEGITLVESCTPCSPGCDHCWALAMENRFAKRDKLGIPVPSATSVMTHPEHLKRFNARKPKVFAIWNDLFHEAVPGEFIISVYAAIWHAIPLWWTSSSNDGYPCADGHTFIILTKRHERMLAVLTLGEFWKRVCAESGTDMRNVSPPPFIWHGLTVCNQQEADEKIPIFLQVPGKKFLSIEPMLGPIDLHFDWYNDLARSDSTGRELPLHKIDAVILGGETGPGARPLHPDWVRSVRDQCAPAGVPFFFKQWGEWRPESQFGQHVPSIQLLADHAKTRFHQWSDGSRSYPIKRSDAGRLLDGCTHDDLPWRVK